MQPPAPGQRVDDSQASKRVAAAKFLRKQHLKFRAAVAAYKFARRDAERYLGPEDARALVRSWTKRAEG
jgi:hypothetical protein